MSDRGNQIGRALGNAARGVAIGAANVVPGVSGGTIAVVTGIYDELIGAIGEVLSSRWRLSLAYLLPVLAGIFTGIGLFAAVIEWALLNAAEQTAFFFVGLIAGSVPFLWRVVRQEPIRPLHIGLFIVALAVLIVQAVVGDPPRSAPITAVTPLTVWALLAAGAIATGTMIIPGVSGSFVLLLIGMYSTFLNAVRTFNVPVLLILIVGAAAGLWGVARVMNRLLQRHRSASYWVILGLVVGSIVGIWPQMTVGPVLALDAVALATGAALAVVFGKGGSGT